jgi:hypothetical protein
MFDRGTRSDQRYGDTVAVDDLTFEVRPGVVTGFLGPTGAGIIDQFDLGPFLRAYRADGRGRQAYDPKLLLGMLLYGMSVQPAERTKGRRPGRWSGSSTGNVHSWPRGQPPVVEHLEAAF